MEPTQKEKKCAQERQKYANMQPEQMKARIEQIAANRELKRNTPCKDSNVMESTAYIAIEEEVLNLYDKDFMVSRHTTEAYMHGRPMYTTFLLYDVSNSIEVLHVRHFYYLYDP